MQPASDDDTTRDDLSARERIRDAAIAEFGKHGVAGTSLKTIARRAEVSQALIVHHFGSKDALRAACDAHVAALIGQRKREQLQPGFDPLAALRSADQSGPLLRYLGHTLGDGRREVTALVDDMIADAHDYMATAEAAQLMKPSAYPRERTVILVLWSLGLLSLHQHVNRHLGIDLLEAAPDDLAPYLLPVAEMLGEGVLADGMFDQLRTAMEQLQQEGRS